MDYIEMTGKTINEAVDSAKEILGLGYDEIDYEVIEEPRKGIFGIGSKPARVLVKRIGFDIEKDKKEKEEKAAKEAEKLRKQQEKEAERLKKQQEKEAQLAAKQAEKKAENIKKNAEKAEQTERPKKQYAEKKTPAQKKTAPVKETEVSEVTSAEPKAEETKAEINTDKAVEDASVFLKEVFRTMNLDVEVEKQDENGRQLYLNLTGDDMGVIIGKRGQTLDSLQYLTNLIVNKGNSPYISIHLDTKDYRKKRKETLENLAKNLAKKAKHIRRNVILEPMNPYERRIIHSALQNDRYVTTFSEGEEPYRHVVISPKYKY